MGAMLTNWFTVSVEVTVVYSGSLESSPVAEPSRRIPRYHTAPTDVLVMTVAVCRTTLRQYIARMVRLQALRTTALSQAKADRGVSGSSSSAQPATRTPTALMATSAITMATAVLPNATWMLTAARASNARMVVA